MFNFYVNLTGHDMITVAGRATTLSEIESPIITKKKYIKRRNFRKHGFQRQNRLKFSDKINNTSSLNQTNP